MEDLDDDVIEGEQGDPHADLSMFSPVFICGKRVTIKQEYSYKKANYQARWEVKCQNRGHPNCMKTRGVLIDEQWFLGCFLSVCVCVCVGVLCVGVCVSVFMCLSICASIFLFVCVCLYVCGCLFACFMFIGVFNVSVVCVFVRTVWRTN